MMLQNGTLTQTHPTSTGKQPRIYAEFIHQDDEIGRAQRLRYEVFCEEYNIELASHKTWSGLPVDAEALDDYCLHLVVRNQGSEDIIGYTRVLTCERAKRYGSYYSSQEFNIDRLLAQPGRFLEIGRTCIHPDYRNGSTIAVLWSFLARYMQENDYRYLFGCASVSLNDGGSTLAAIMPVIREKHLTSKDYSVEPRIPLEGLTTVEGVKVNFPPLLKAYLRIGAQVCGEPCWDPEFNVADLLVVLDLNNVAARYAKHFLKPQQAA